MRYMKCRYIDESQDRKNSEKKTGTTELYMVTRFFCQRFQWKRFISLLDESKIVFMLARVFVFSVATGFLVFGLFLNSFIWLFAGSARFPQESILAWSCS